MAKASSRLPLPLLDRDEHIVRQQECRMKWDTARGEDAQRGILYLTDQRLIFEGNIGGLLSKKYVLSFEEKLEAIQNVSIASSILGVTISRSGVGVGTRGIMVESSKGLRTFVGIDEPQPWLDSVIEKVHARRDKIEEMSKKEDEQRRIDEDRRHTQEVELRRASAQREVVKEVQRQELVMVPCGYCSNLMPENSLFCPNCGAKRKT